MGHLSPKLKKLNAEIETKCDAEVERIKKNKNNLDKRFNVKDRSACRQKEDTRVWSNKRVKLTSIERLVHLQVFSAAVHFRPRGTGQQTPEALLQGQIRGPYLPDLAQPKNEASTRN